jgi:hypothetical protein
MPVAASSTHSTAISSATSEDQQITQPAVVRLRTQQKRPRQGSRSPRPSSLRTPPTAHRVLHAVHLIDRSLRLSSLRTCPPLTQYSAIVHKAARAVVALHRHHPINQPVTPRLLKTCAFWVAPPVMASSLAQVRHSACAAGRGARAGPG